MTCDRYPYTASNTHLSALWPDWAHDGALDEKIERLADTETRARIRGEIIQAHPEPLLLGEHPDQPGVHGGEPALRGSHPRAPGRDPRRGPRGCDARFADRGEDERRDSHFHDECGEHAAPFLGKPYVMVGSDAGALTHEPPLGAGRPHPRNFGTFPFVLGALARDEGLFPLTEAIRKMTSAPCDRLGIADRGRLAVGMKADLVLFDPDEIRDECTYERPIAYPSGVEMVLVNGEVVVEGGNHTGARPGRALRKLSRRGKANV